MAPNIVVFAPMPIANDATAIAMNPGDRFIARSP
jgi:hypothetical protein